MRPVTIPACIVAAMIAFAPVIAGATDDDQIPEAAQEACRVASIPAHTRTVERTLTEPPVRCEQRVPRYETVTEPVYETRRLPVYETVEKPVYETREVPVFRTECVPVWGEKEVTAYREVRTPVTIEVWNPFACEDECIELWDTCEQVPDGTRTVRAIVGHETRQVQCGMRLEQHRVGTRAEEVLTGYRCERVQVGERAVRRLVGYETQTVVTQAARERVVREHEAVPCESVTVIPDGTTRSVPLRGTTRVMTEREYAQALADAQRSPRELVGS
jgi:hypothetical protein